MANKCNKKTKEQENDHKIEEEIDEQIEFQVESEIFIHCIKYLYNKQIIKDDVFDVISSGVKAPYTQLRDELLSLGEDENRVMAWYKYIDDLAQNKVKEFETIIKEDLIKESKQSILN